MHKCTTDFSLSMSPGERCQAKDDDKLKFAGLPLTRAVLPFGLPVDYDVDSRSIEFPAGPVTHESKSNCNRTINRTSADDAL